MVLTCCCGGVCDKCDDTPPNTMEVVISGLANDNCTDCATLDGTYDCTLNSSNPANCYWQYLFPGGSNCNAFSVSVFNGLDSVGASAPGLILVRLRFESAGILLCDVFWSVTQTIVSGTDVIDCNVSTLSVPFDNDHNYVGPLLCTGAAATATVTAIP